MAIKASYQAGETDVSARSLAAAIIDDLNRQGVRVCGLHTISQWLLRK